jgi:hypothetical protein
VIGEFDENARHETAVRQRALADGKCLIRQSFLGRIKIGKPDFCEALSIIPKDTKRDVTNGYLKNDLDLIVTERV